MTDPIGKTIDGYVVEGLLGKGGMGAVYRALDSALERHVALKIVSGEHLDDAGYLARFEREAKAASSVSHPNVAHIYGTGRFEGRPYYVMELVEGQSLADLLARDGRIPSERALDFLRQACQGLRAAHQKGIVHRDLKPDNLMVDTQGRLRVVDFGLARRMESGHTITRIDRVMGTPRYMSPEQAKEGRGDHRSDMYSLGATFFHLLAGVPPFEGDSSLSVMLKHVNDSPPRLATLAPDAAPGVVALVHRLLAKAPESRFATYDELLGAIDAISARSAPAPAGGRSTVPVAPAKPQSAATVLLPRETHRPSGWLWPALGGAAAALGLVLVLGPSRREERPAAPLPTQAAVPTQFPTPFPTVAPPPTPRPSLSAPVADTLPEPTLPPPGDLDRGPLSAIGTVRDRGRELLVTRETLRSLAGRLDDYTQRNGEPPRGLADVGEGSASDAWGHPIHYEASGAGYRLASPGPDGRLGSEDDVLPPPLRPQLPSGPLRKHLFRR